MLFDLRHQLRRLIGASPVPGSDDELARSGGWSALLRVAGMVASFLLGVLLARFLAPTGLGTYGIIVAAAAFLAAISQAGLPTLAVRELSVAVDRHDWRLASGVIFWFGRIVLALSLIAAICLMMALLFWSTGQPEASAGEVIWGAALVPLLALTALINAQLRALGKMTAGQSLEIFIRPVLMSILCLAAYLFMGGFSVQLAVILNVTAALATLIVGLFLLWRAVPEPVKKAAPQRNGRRWLRASIPLTSIDGLKQIDLSYGLLILGALVASEEAGYLRVALSTIIFVALPQSVMHVVLAPTLARLSASGDRQELQRILTKSSRLMFSVTLVALIMLLAVGQPALTFIFGAAYAPSWLPLVLLTLAQLVNSFFGVGWVLLTMSGGERLLTRSYVISVPLGIIAAIPLCISAGANGAAAASVFGTLVQNLLAWRAVYAHRGVDSSILSGAPTTQHDEQTGQVR